MNILTVNNISMNYHSIKGETKALDNINFKIDEGEFISLLGPSGCGKTTLLNILAGILKPSSGTILLKGDNIKNNLDKIGYMFQKDHLFEWNTVLENVELGLKIKKKLTKENEDRVFNLLKEYELYKFKDHYPSELSGGMRQRVALIRTLALNPEILFLDEPFSALDYQSRLKICDDVHEIIKKEKKTSIMVTHDIAEAISMSDRIIVLTKRPGKVKDDMKISFNNQSLTPFNRRQESEFKSYFDYLWKEIDAK